MSGHKRQNALTFAAKRRYKVQREVVRELLIAGATTSPALLDELNVGTDHGPPPKCFIPGCNAYIPDGYNMQHQVEYCIPAPIKVVLLLFNRLHIPREIHPAIFEHLTCAHWRPRIFLPPHYGNRPVQTWREHSRIYS
jgi:hypothetical protein